MEGFEVLGKVTNPPEMGGGVQYVCMINGVKWFVPDDPANADRQRVKQWEDEGNVAPDITAAEASEL